ncbi:hypothetical protein P389DRAFT_212641 [Cystobasidium minutum MCA 4210]|uniref:uncharacterized protein n=1 Tax=Cystobasidium minutum MCA 4210 TaxID=1397322 RepID=UPI0034CDA5B0|eukprot:jgi/Rhomi1/212641/estExt_Genemark1.C_70142
MESDTRVLIIVLSCVFGFLFAVFLFLILRFTFRVRSLGPRSSSSTRLADLSPRQTRHTQSMKETPLQWKDRWSSKSRGDRAAVRGMDDDEVEAQGGGIIHDKTAGEFGATVHQNGTRSFLNGWFALDSPPTVDASFRSHPTRGKHERVHTKDINTGDEWEIKSEVSDSSDPEAYRPQYATI